ncbi:uncharacterized protein LOC115980858 [Quercus lobata]|uniref:uncharacterized protein LOC115980858 n=1 Tax=Quercus lobata TaxID=97700 RepID=UPI00124516CD|nr:uncharacterized protein LOC115980858 [Quercus lobata]
MSSLEADEIMFAYIAVAPHTVSLVLIRVDNGVQRLVYYVSKSLHEAEVCYLPLEKAFLSVVHATRKLPHYFQAHTVVILTQLPLRLVLRGADYTRRIAMWSTLLGTFDIKYMPQTSIKGQVLTDLIAEFTEPPIEAVIEEENIDGKSVSTISTQRASWWKVYVDGTANQSGSEVGLVLISPQMITIEKSLRLGFSATNNEAEYEALLKGMVMVQKMGGKALELFSDSRLVIGQVKGELEARDIRIQEYLGQVKCLQSDFEFFNLTHVSRSENTHTDSATLTTSSEQGLLRIILVEDLCKAGAIKKDMVQIHQVRMSPSWMNPLVSFLKDDVLPKEKLEAEKIRRKAHRFWLSGDHKLYKHSYSGPYLLCVHPEALEMLLEELHKGICDSHIGGRSLAHKALTQEY